MAGDLEKRRLGWDDSTWRSWAERVNEIYHCAASTNFDLPLEQAQRINVGGLLQIHAFSVVAAALGDFRRLHHVSTAYAAGRTRWDVRASETLPPDEERYFRNTYERTKARAERFLRDYAEVPWTIYRPSIIVGDSQSGRTRSWNVCYAPMRLIAAGRLRMVPASSRAILDYVPVDYVVDGISALGQRSDTEGKTLHLTAGEQSCAVPECLRLIDEGVARHKGTSPAHTAVIGPRRFEVLVKSLQAVAPQGCRSARTHSAIRALHAGGDAISERRRSRDAAGRRHLAACVCRLFPADRSLRARASFRQAGASGQKPMVPSAVSSAISWVR